MEHFVDENESHLTRQNVKIQDVKPAAAAGHTNRRALREIENLMGINKQSKKPMPDKVAVDLTTGLVAHRPITRRFAATVGNQSASFYPDPVSKQPLIGSERLTRATAAAVAAPSQDVQLDSPMASAMMEEMESDVEQKEVEMEDIEVEIAPDIDSVDANNPLAVVEYVDEIYKFYRKTEHLSCVAPDYMANQHDINEKMRAILIDWLIEVHYKLELLDETLYLTVNIIDRFLSQHPVIRKRLQLVGVTAMLLACKYEEVTVPVVEDLITICDRAYTRIDILEMEKMICKVLQFNMSVPTPYVFMRRFLKAAESDKKLELLSFFIVELCLVEYSMLRFNPSLLAAAAVYTAQCTLSGLRSWSKCCELHTEYSEDQLMECAKMMAGFHQRAASGKLTGVHRKYSLFRFGCAAASPPALVLLGTN